MPQADTPHVAGLLDDLRRGVNISEQLAKVWPKSPAKKYISRSDSLRLANAIYATETKTPVSTRAYYEAIKEFRFLREHLRPAKSSHPMARAAQVEKYAVNYALRACDEEIQQKENACDTTDNISLTASDVAQESLRLLFEARHGRKSTQPINIKTRTRSASSRTEINVDCLFDGASRIGRSADDFLPRDEPALITAVILASIAVRVSAPNDALPSGARLRLARFYAEPWANYLDTFEDPKYIRKVVASTKRIRNGLSRAAQSADNSPADQFRINAYLFGNGMCKPHFTDFCYNQLRIANKFLNHESELEVEKYAVVSSIIRDTLFLVQKSSVAPVDWLHEDVSTFFDKIIEIEGYCHSLAAPVPPEDRILKDLLLDILKKRRDALKTLDIPECESFVSNLQEEMAVKYCHELLFKPSCMDVTCEMMHLALKETALPKYLLPSEKLFSTHNLTTKMGKKKRMCSKTALRLIRVLEPFRAKICALNTALTKEQIVLLQIYVCAVVLGIQAVKCRCEKTRKERLSQDDIRERLLGSSGDALTALACLLVANIRKGDEKRIASCMAQIDAFIDKKPYGENKGWEKWLFSRIYRACVDIFKKEWNSTAKDKIRSNIMGNTLIYTTKWVGLKSCSDFGTNFYERNCTADYHDTVMLAVQCYLRAGYNERATTTVAHHLVRSFCCEPCVLNTDGGLTPSNRPGFLRTFARVTRLIEAKREPSKFADFINLITRGSPLSGYVCNILGRNFVMALSQYIVHVRQSFEVDDLAGSRYVRSAVTARYQLLKALKLKGRCFNLQVHLEWNQLLMEGISVGKENFSPQGSSDNLLSLADITADTPRGGWSTDVLKFDNGTCIEVALTPRVCHCQVCSCDGFALLHILRDSWRLAVQKQPPLLREHLWRLEKFLSASDINTLDTTLAILCLEFLEWCQVYSILSSIHGQPMMASMIRRLKKHLNIVSKLDVGAIYSSHGFLAGRPYYSGLIERNNNLKSGGRRSTKEDDGDIRVNFFEKEEFMYTGCRADVYLRNLDFEKAFNMAKKSLILLLQRLKTHDDHTSGMRSELTIGGIQVAIHGSIVSPLDKLRALETLELIHALERLATVNLQIENFNDANYYFQKASLVSKQLCGAESLIHLRQNKVVFKNSNALSTRVPLKEVNQFLKSGVNEIAVRKHGKFDNTLVSNSYTVVADVALAAVEVDDEYNDRKKRLDEMGKLAAKFLRLALDSLAELDTETEKKKNNNNHITGDHSSDQDVERVNSIIHSDVSLKTGEAELLLGNVKVAIETFEKVKKMGMNDTQASNSYLCALLGLSSALIYKLGGPESVAAIMKNEKDNRRRGRQTKKIQENRAMATQVANNLREGETILGERQWEPYRRMEFFMLHALIFGPMDAANKGLAWEIGSGFTIRWNMKNKKNNNKIVGNGTRRLVHGRKMDNNNNNKPEAKQRQKLLRDANIVVFGISLDSSNGALIFWRYSCAGFFTAKLQIPTSGKASYDALLRRFSGIAEGLKQNALPMTTGESFSNRRRNSWWSQQFELDTDMRKILEDVEDQWFGSSKLLLLPAIEITPDDDTTHNGNNNNNINDNSSTASAVAANALASIQAAYSDECSADNLVEALERLNINGDATDSSNNNNTASDFWKDTASKKKSCSGGHGEEEKGRGNAVFVIDSRLEFIPFECLPILRNNNVGSTRVPSLSYLFHQLERQHKPTNNINSNRRKVYYLLNPGGDLRRTEAKFRAQFEGRKDWSGISGTIIANNSNNINKNISAAISRGARNADVFLYCGHGTGEKYLSPSCLDAKSSNNNNKAAPVAVLMGCSSVKLKRHGGFRGSSGTLLEYLMNGAPAVVGNLWDVTDKDIDRLTEAFLANWLGAPTSITEHNNNRKARMGIADALADARSACKLPHLVGAATIIYGLPFL